MDTSCNSTNETVVEQEGENRLLCPNCQTLNPPNTRVCASCGVSIADFRVALPHIRQLQDQNAALRQEALEKDAASAIASEAAKGKKRLGILIWIALAVAAIVAVAIVIATAWLAYTQQLRRERLAEQYEAAVTCLEEGDYVCARDGFEAVLKQNPDHDDARYHLNEARRGLAEQYVAAGQWKAAIDELDALLVERPDDARALALMKETYDRWIQDATGRGEWLTALFVRLQRDARFPPDER